ncbi:hypothetical protein LCGC14_0461630 [marine sediment metagenome]|uniref:Uncharacterized protein n=1 Tax=marine sediment metagenome TaxID=412755 RepID=A0A0F9SEY0_9ZZZZ
MKLDQKKLEARTLQIIRRLKHKERPCRFDLPTSIGSTQIRGLIQALCEQINGEDSDG